MTTYAVALFVPYVVRVSGIEADSPEQAIERATAFARECPRLQEPVMDGGLDCRAEQPTLCYIEPQDDLAPIGALVDVVNPALADIAWGHPECDQYHALDGLQCYAPREGG
jgi:hypothetical protein